MRLPRLHSFVVWLPLTALMVTACSSGVGSTRALPVGPASAVTGGTVRAQALSSAGKPDVLINAGGPATAGFSADAFFTDGSSEGTDPVPVDVSGVVNAAPQAVFSTYRTAPQTLTYDVTGLTPNSLYHGFAYFEEPTCTHTDERRFDLAVRGGTVVTSIDLYGLAHQAHKAVVLYIDGFSDAIGQLQITLSATVGEPIISAFELHRDAIQPSTVPQPASEIYVLNGGNKISVYSATVTGNADEAPLATINGSATGLSGPSGIAVDAQGRIYVANAYANSITVYPANPIGALNEAPIAVIGGAATGLNLPTGVSLDATGKIYVSNSSPTYPYYGNISVFAANPVGSLNEPPLATITNDPPKFGPPTAIAVGAGGTIYTSYDYAFSIVGYPAVPIGSLQQAPLYTILATTTQVEESGHSYYTQCDAGPCSPQQLAVDASGRVYDADQYGYLDIFDAPSRGSSVSQPVATIFAGQEPSGVALDKLGTIYAADPQTNTIFIFAAYSGAKTGATTLAKISGGATGLSNPSAIAVH